MSDQSINSNLYIEGVDQDVPIERLLPATDCRRLMAIATAFLATEVRLVTPQGEVLAGTLSAEPRQRQPLTSEFETVAFLECADPRADLAALARVLDWCLEKQLKYLMTSSAHHLIVESDYRELQERNRKLAESEARYRDLAGALEQKVAEQVELIKVAERKLYQQEKLASVGQLAAGVAHEINNPVGFVTSNLRMASDYVAQLKRHIAAIEAQLPPGSSPQENNDIPYLCDDFDELLQESIDGCERVSRIVKNLKDFSNVDGTELARESVNTIIERVCALYRAQLPAGVELKLELGEVPLVMLKVGHMVQVLSNLLSNAMAAVGSNAAGAIVLSTGEDDSGVWIRVSDNGCGMSADTQHRAFDPFFTTREVGQGTGLGLSVCRDIVLAHKGRIELSSQLGRGTVVTLSLPISGAE